MSNNIHLFDRSPLTPIEPHQQGVSPHRGAVKRNLSFGSPAAANETSLAWDADPEIEYDSSYSTKENAAKKLRTMPTIETSFKAFLASFQGPASSTTAATSSRNPPGIAKDKKGRQSVAERIKSLRRITGKTPEELEFIEAAHQATSSTGELEKVGEGTFSVVYLVPGADAKAATVRKVFKDNTSSGGTLRPLQGTERLYNLAVASEKQFKMIKEAHASKNFPVAALDILNINTWRKDGFITQPFITEKFQPSWQTFVEKINTHGKLAQITDEEERLVGIIQAVFQKSIECGLCIDFKPDNLGYANNQVVIIDTFGLSGEEKSEPKLMTLANILEFSQGNSLIHAYLSQVVD